MKLAVKDDCIPDGPIIRAGDGVGWKYVEIWAGSLNAVMSSIQGKNES